MGLGVHREPNDHVHVLLTKKTTPKTPLLTAGPTNKTYKLWHSHSFKKPSLPDIHPAEVVVVQA